MSPRAAELRGKDQAAPARAAVVARPRAFPILRCAAAARPRAGCSRSCCQARCHRAPPRLRRKRISPRPSSKRPTARSSREKVSAPTVRAAVLPVPALAARPRNTPSRPDNRISPSVDRPRSSGFKPVPLSAISRSKRPSAVGVSSGAAVKNSRSTARSATLAVRASV